MKYVIGFDGGGTKTEMVAVDADGYVLSLSKGGASNPKAVTLDKAQLHIIELLDQLYDKESLQPIHCQGICLGLAGIDTEQEKESILQLVRRYYIERGIHHLPIRVTNDAEIALMAGLGNNQGIIAIAGTGAIVYGITPTGQNFRTGGWGHILGDKGSGYEIGLLTLQTVMSSFDGIRPPTQLTKLVMDLYGLSSPHELRSYIYQPHIQKKHIAESAELCIRAAELRDQAAQEIITNAATDLANLTAAIRTKDSWFANSPIAVTGSIFKHSSLYREAYKKHLESIWIQPTVVATEQTPAYGAALLAAREVGE
jgi:N-acetylglucosamine kinase-like BadF-type ATPase